MPIRTGDILTELDKYASHDTVILKAVASAQKLLKKSELAGKFSNTKIALCDFTDVDTNSKLSFVFTESCKAILTVPIIIFNEKFLKEVEGAIRSFYMSRSLLHTQYFQSDASMFGLIQRLSMNTNRYLKRLRSMVEKYEEDEIAEEFTMAIFYFISHEIGHLLCEKNQRNYGSFLDKDSPLECRMANAVVKMGMHMDDLSEYGFVLDNGPRADKSYKQIKQVADALKATVEDATINHPIWFKDEKDADEKANELVIEYLTTLGDKEDKAADRMLYRFVRGLFAAGIYSWYKDLSSFLDKLGCGSTFDANSLMIEMLQSRERYIEAASLFGDVHRFTLLRAFLTIEHILRSLCEWFEEDIETRSIWYARDPVDPPDSFPELKKWRLAENLQRCALLSILMDTAVKMSYLGFSTGWMKEIDKKRGTPQLFMMTFYPLQHELGLLKKRQ